MRHLVSLNPAGKQKLDELRAISRGIDDEFLAGLDADARKELHELLLQVARHHDPRYSS
jgi:DNA-binding MarR family transcriptional regulator